MTDEFKDFVCTYRFCGSEWGITVRARSKGEAEARLKAISLGRVDGELRFTVSGSAPRGLVSFLTRLLSWMRPS